MGMPKAETVRAFVALDLDARSVRRVVRVADRLRMAGGAPSATWTPTERVHLTLRFMPDLPAKAVAPLGKALGALVDAEAPQAGTCSLQAFPSAEQASVIVIELADPLGGLSRLAAKIDKLAVRHGASPREPVEFRPHVTLARLKRPYDSRRWLNPELADAAGEFTVARLVLNRSDLGAAKDGGPVYAPLATFDYGTG